MRDIDTTTEVVHTALNNINNGLVRSVDLETLGALAAERDKLAGQLAEALEALSLIAVMGYSDDPKVNASIARQAVKQASAARARITGDR
jgi:hypothetical protein